MPGILTSLLCVPARVATVAGVTLTQLVRMRLFLALAVFAAGFLLLQFIPYQQNLGIEFQGVQQLQLIKDIGLGCMQFFGLVFGVSATSMLIPRDGEDRILYTILCKPVPRFDYLAGKALGVIALLLLMMALMDGLTCLLLAVREGGIARELQSALQARGLGEAEIAPYLAQMREAAVTWNMQRGVLALALGYAVLVTLTLLISCVTSGSIVSMIFGLGAYFIGMFQSTLFEALAGGAGMGPGLEWASRVCAICLPDFSLFTVADTASAGVALSLPLLGQLFGIAVLYMVLHLLVATWVFNRKEF